MLNLTPVSANQVLQGGLAVQLNLLRKFQREMGKPIHQALPKGEIILVRVGTFACARMHVCVTCPWTQALFGMPLIQTLRADLQAFLASDKKNFSKRVALSCEHTVQSIWVRANKICHHNVEHLVMKKYFYTRQRGAPTYTRVRMQDESASGVDGVSCMVLQHQHGLEYPQSRL